MQVLKEELTVQETTARVDDVIQKEVNPKYIIEAVAIQLGLKPSMCSHLWPHYVAMIRRQPLVPCIRCGAASTAEMVCDVEGPTFLINRTRSVNKEVSFAFKAAREYLGSVAHTKESELMIFNGFCEICLADIEDQLPPAMKLAVPEDPDLSKVRDLVAKALRQGHVYDTIKALRRVVDQHTGSIV